MTTMKNLGRFIKFYDNKYHFENNILNLELTDTYPHSWSNYDKKSNSKSHYCSHFNKKMHKYYGYWNRYNYNRQVFS